jgi:small subunit ribosomal protein S4
MARDTSPQCKQCRREGQKLFLKGERCLTDKCGVERRSYPPGDHGRGRQKQSEYRVQLREKQKAKRYYGVLESQFRIYYGKASRQTGVTGENLLRMLECRFDNILVRLGFAASRRQARQLILHGHWTINGRRVNIPSYQLRDNDVIAIHSKAAAGKVVTVIQDATELTGQVPAWLQADHDALTAKVLRKPERREIAAPVQEQLIVELYSK